MSDTHGDTRMDMSMGLTYLGFKVARHALQLINEHGDKLRSLYSYGLCSYGLYSYGLL